MEPACPSPGSPRHRSGIGSHGMGVNPTCCRDSAKRTMVSASSLLAAQRLGTNLARNLPLSFLNKTCCNSPDHQPCSLAKKALRWLGQLKCPRQYITLCSRPSARKTLGNRFTASSASRRWSAWQIHGLHGCVKLIDAMPAFVAPQRGEKSVCLTP